MIVQFLATLYSAGGGHPRGLLDPQCRTRCEIEPSANALVHWPQIAKPNLLGALVVNSEGFFTPSRIRHFEDEIVEGGE
jgi:hypothetical protein